jgi:hypothetical protein
MVETDAKIGALALRLFGTGHKIDDEFATYLGVGTYLGTFQLLDGTVWHAFIESLTAASTL